MNIHLTNESLGISTRQLHMGGIWEGIIRTVKIVVFSLVKSTVLTDYQLMSIFTQIEAIVNNRPLTYVSDNPNTLEPLTPNYPVIGRYNNDLFTEENDGDISSLRRWKKVFAISNQFWKRGLIKYLPTLQSRHK